MKMNNWYVIRREIKDGTITNVIIEGFERVDDAANKQLELDGGIWYELWRASKVELFSLIEEL